MMMAAPFSIGRAGGAWLLKTAAVPSSAIVRRAPVAARVASVAAAGALRATGTTTPPAAQTPRKAAKSRGALATGTRTGSSAAKFCSRKASAVLRAAAASSP